MDRYGYIYKTTNNINGKIYIGQKKSPTVIENYYGSGPHILNAIKKYGVENFSRCIIDWAENQEDLDNKEIFWIAFLEARVPSIGYNYHEGGHSCVSLPGVLNPRYGVKITDETRQRMRESHLGIKPSKETVDKRRVTLSRVLTGRVMSNEWRNNLSEAHKNIKQSQETIDKRMSTIKEKYPDGVHHKCPESVKQYYSSLHKGKKAINNGLVWTYTKDEDLPEGFVYGKGKGLKYVRSI